MASKTKGTPQTASKTKAKAKTAPHSASTVPAKAKVKVEEPKVLTLAEIQAKHAAGEALTADEALTFIRGKAEADRSAAERLTLLESTFKAEIKAARKAVRVESKTLASTGTAKLIEDYVGNVGQSFPADPDFHMPDGRTSVPSLIAAIHGMNPGRIVKRLTVRYTVNEDGKAETKVAFKLAKVETPTDKAA